MRSDDHRIIDLFAGPGGWDEALGMLGRHDVLGVEYDEPCCRTREAAGHATLHANVAELDPLDYVGIEGLIASPPCQAWSMAGARGGELDKVLVYYVMEQLMQGRDVRAAAREDAADERSLLVVEPLRWVLALRPRWVAFEQVEPVAELWAWMAEQLRTLGYSAWSGILSAERYGVPQTRRRAFLIASLDVAVEPPRATHQAYRKGEPAEHTFTLEGELLPWISMAEALGWTDDGVLRTGANSMVTGRTGSRAGDGDVQPYQRPTDAPAPTLDAKVGGAWKMVANAQANACVRSCEEPAPTIKGGHDYNDRRWILSTGRDWQPDGSSQEVDADRPAPSVTGKSGGQWAWKRPAPTITGGGSKQGGPEPIANAGMRERMLGAERVTLEQALVLQGFRPDYPVQGNKGQQFQQVGNAVPPPLARAVLTSVLTPAAQEVIPHAV